MKTIELAINLKLLNDQKHTNSLALHLHGLQSYEKNK